MGSVRGYTRRTKRGVVAVSQYTRTTRMMAKDALKPTGSHVAPMARSYARASVDKKAGNGPSTTFTSNK